MTGFCTTEDVRRALQKRDLNGPTDPEIVEPAIEGASNWFARATNGHWFDSAEAIPPLSDTVATAQHVRLDVPSSPHRQDRQLLSGRQGARYPVTHAGPYAEIRLPHLHVQTVNTLEVRGRGGDVTDWVAAADKTAGRGEDYYAQRKGQDSYGRTYLYVRADSIGPRIDFGGLLTLEYDYGLDYQTEAWDDVRRGIAHLAAADVMDEDDVLTQIPDQGQLVGVQTQYDNLMSAATKRLNPYISAMGQG